MINVEVPKEITFDLKEGQFKATVSAIKPFPKQTAKGMQDWIRILFEVNVPGVENLDCRAGRNFQLSFKAGSDLRNFLAPILGAEFFKANSAKKLDLETLLIGKIGVVSLRHFCGEEYDKPMVVVDAFEPMTTGGKD